MGYSKVIDAPFFLQFPLPLPISILSYPFHHQELVITATLGDYKAACHHILDGGQWKTRSFIMNYQSLSSFLSLFPKTKIKQMIFRSRRALAYASTKVTSHYGAADLAEKMIAQLSRVI